MDNYFNLDNVKEDTKVKPFKKQPTQLGTVAASTSNNFKFSEIDENRIVSVKARPSIQYKLSRTYPDFLKAMKIEITGSFMNGYLVTGSMTALKTLYGFIRSDFSSINKSDKEMLQWADSIYDTFRKNPSNDKSNEFYASSYFSLTKEAQLGQAKQTFHWNIPFEYDPAESEVTVSYNIDSSEGYIGGYSTPEIEDIHVFRDGVDVVDQLPKDVLEALKVACLENAEEQPTVDDIKSDMGDQRRDEALDQKAMGDIL